MVKLAIFIDGGDTFWIQSPVTFTGTFEPKRVSPREYLNREFFSEGSGSGRKLASSSCWFWWVFFHFSFCRTHFWFCYLPLSTWDLIRTANLGFTEVSWWWYLNETPWSWLQRSFLVLFSVSTIFLQNQVSRGRSVSDLHLWLVNHLFTHVHSKVWIRLVSHGRVSQDIPDFFKIGVLDELSTLTSLPCCRKRINIFTALWWSDT